MKKLPQQPKTRTFSLVPTPTKLGGSLRSDRELAQHRRLYCAHYAGCLSVSVREEWAGFSCVHCPLRDLHDARPAIEPFAEQRLGNDPNS